MRYLLLTFNASTPLQLGFKFGHSRAIRQGFMSGGAGYILTKEAIRRFVEIGLNQGNTPKANTTENIKNSLCASGHQGPEDVNLGNIWSSVECRKKNTRPILFFYFPTIWDCLAGT